MKITMDLYPKQFKCIPRAWKGIYLLLAMVVIDVALWFGLKYYYDSVLKGIEEMGEEMITVNNDELRRCEQEKSKKTTQLEKVMLQPTEILNLNKQIDFFNKIYEKSFSWYEFIDRIEQLTPKNVWIKQIKVTFGEEIADQEFELNCESTEPYDAPQFLKNIVTFPEFAGPARPGAGAPAAAPGGPGAAPAAGGAPGAAPAAGPSSAPRERGQPLLSTVVKNDDGGHEFSMKFRFLPIKSFFVFKPGEKKRTPLAKLEALVGQTVRVSVQGMNITKEEFVFSPSQYRADIADNAIGFWAPYDETFTARMPGKTDLVFTTLDRRITVRVPVEVRAQ